MDLSRRWIAPSLLLFYVLALFVIIHVGPRGLTERDGYFHARYANMLPARGLSRRFPWTQASPWKHRFADKEFLFHVLLVPFTRGEEPIQGALVFSVLMSTAVFAAFFFFLKANKVRGPTLFTFVLLCMGGPFLLRMSFLRPHVLSVVFCLAGLHCLIRGRWKELTVIGFAYSWTYSFPFVLPLLALPFYLGAAWAGKPLDRKCLAAAFGGVLLGLLVHPYTPYSLDSVGLYLEILRHAAGPRGLAAVEVGREFAPYSTRTFLIAFPLLTLLLAAAGLGGWSTKKRISPEAMGLLCAATAATLATMVYMRAIEYAAPVTAAALAFLVRDLLDEEGRKDLGTFLADRTRLGLLALAALILLLGGTHIQSLSYTFGLSGNNEPPRFRKASDWMSQNMLPGETIVNLWWDDFPDLFYHGHRQRFIVGLDPTYLLRYDRKTAMRLEDMRLGRAPIDADWLANTFAARYMILRTPLARFYPQLMTPAWAPVYLDRLAAVFALKGPAGPPEHLKGLPQIPALGPRTP